MRRALALVALLCAGCAVKGYDLGWRSENPLTPLLGQPLDALSNCSAGVAQSAPPACQDLAADVRRRLEALPPTADAPVALGFRCRNVRCAYGNVWERRDVGAATLIPVYRKVALRQVRIAAARGGDGIWTLDTLVIRDSAGPAYGPVRIGGAPAK